MQPRRAYLLLLWGMLGSFVPVGLYGSPRHSLRYFYLRVSESSRELPEFLSVILLDDQPIARYDNRTNRMEPLVPWMGAEKVKIQGLKRMFRADLQQLSGLSNQTEGLHTWQAILGCELEEDRSKGGFLHYGHNGMDFISFDKETRRWVAAQPQAQKVKEKWDNDPRRSKWYKGYIEKMCIESMQKYLPYQKESLKKTEPPLGKVTHMVNDSLEALICQAYGFYPKEIQVNWTRDGEVWLHGILNRTMSPNSDGTYHYKLSIRIDPKERDRYRCHVEHEGLQEPLDLELKEPINSIFNPWPIIIGFIVAALVLVGVIAGILVFFKRCQDNCKAALTSKRGSRNPDQASFLANDTESNISDHASKRGSRNPDQASFLANDTESNISDQASFLANDTEANISDHASFLANDTESNISDHASDTESNISDQGSSQTLSTLLAGDKPSIKIEE